VARTVTDGECSVAFYTAVLNFPVLAPMGARVLLRNGTMVLALGPAPHQPLSDDCSDENRVGPDHLSFAAADLADLERAVLLTAADDGPARLWTCRPARRSAASLAMPGR
jgi:hypothetical protein